jgi:hypothetical protein
MPYRLAHDLDAAEWKKHLSTATKLLDKVPKMTAALELLAQDALAVSRVAANDWAKVRANDASAPAAAFQTKTGLQTLRAQAKEVEALADAYERKCSNDRLVPHGTTEQLRKVMQAAKQLMSDVDDALDPKSATTDWLRYLS